MVGGDDTERLRTTSNCRRGVESKQIVRPRISAQRTPCGTALLMFSGSRSGTEASACRVLALPHRARRTMGPATAYSTFSTDEKFCHKRRTHSGLGSRLGGMSFFWLLLPT
ncbi:hypothetical protein GN958_ATG09527 [Phytophthora infestans]|nr:hypothetical protein GN958_ATG09527 [Phytophthora infestans]